MKRMSIALFGVALVMGLAVGTGPAGAKQTPLKADCKNGGWQYLVDAAGHPFKNQGGCVSFVAQGGQLSVQLALSGSGSATVTMEFSAFRSVGSMAVSGQVNPGGATSGAVNFDMTSAGFGIVGPPAPNSFVVQLTGGTITGHTTTFGTTCVANCAFPPTAGFTNDVTATVAVDSGNGQFAGFATGSLTVHYFATLNGWPPPVTETITGATITGTLTP